MLPELPCDIEGRYTVVAELGRGSHAIVYQAHDRVLERDVAIKVLREELVDSSVSERFRREIRLTSKLDHPHIAHVYGTGEWRGAPYFVIALARGPSLAERLAREHQLPVDEALAIARQVAAALGHAHTAGIIHRDVKPANILLTPDGALLTDFGVARALEYSAGTLATSTGTAVGTLQYMSPEQLCAEKGIDGRSDQYELALVLYEMLAGVPPHVAANTEGLRALRLVGQQVPVRTHRPSVAPAVEAAIERALCPTPADRFGSMGEFVVALDGGDSGSGALRVSAARRTVLGQATDGGAASASRARRWAMAGVAVLGLAAVALFAAPRITRNGASSQPTIDAGLEATATVFRIRSVGDTSRSAPMARSLIDELSAWPDVRAEWVTDRTNGEPRGGSTRLEVRVAPLDGGTQVVVDLRTADRAPLVRRVAIRLPADGPAARDSVRLLAGRLLMARVVSPDSADELFYVRERPTASVRRFGEAWLSLLGGRLTEAEEQFAEAGRSGALPQAALWRALVGSWRQPRAPAHWRDAARRATQLSAHLSRHDSLLALGLDRRASAAFSDACDPFVRATRENDASFAAWFGAAQCASADSVVIADAQSPTQWRFRTAHWSTLRTYEDAIRRLPSRELVKLFDGLENVALAVNGTRRTGRLPAAPQTAFVGLPSVSSDSVVVLPLHEASLLSGDRNTVPDSYQRAVRIGRTRLIELSRLLVDRAPASVHAQLALARAYEYSGALHAAGDQASASTTLSRALSLATSRRDTIEIGLAELRLHLRLGAFLSAAEKGSELLARSGNVSASEAGQLAIVATLVGRFSEARTLFVSAHARSPENEDGAPPGVAEALARYIVFTVARPCVESDTARAALTSSIRDHFAASELADAVSRWVEPVDWMRLHCERAALPSVTNIEDPALRAFILLRRGQTRQAGDLARTMVAERRGVAASALSWDSRFAEAYILARSNDSSAARAQLTAAVTDLAGSMDLVLYDVSQVAGFRRSMRLCADLWHDNDQHETQRQCAAAVTALRIHEGHGILLSSTLK